MTGVHQGWTAAECPAWLQSRAEQQLLSRRERIDDMAVRWGVVRALRELEAVVSQCEAYALEAERKGYPGAVKGWRRAADLGRRDALEAAERWA